MSKRYSLPDLLKGLAVILMIQVHLTELLIEESFLNSQAGKLSLFLGGVPAAPLFMTVMGFFIIYANKSVKANILRGIKLIVHGFAVNIGMNIHLFAKIVFDSWKIDPLPYLFGADILFIAGISIILIVLLIKSFGYNAMVFALLALIISALSSILPTYSGDSFTIRYPLAFIHSYDWWAYFPVIPWFSYPLIGAAAGIYFKNYNQEVGQLLSKPILLIILIMLVTLMWTYGFHISTDLFSFYHHGVRFFVWAVMFLIIIIVLVNFFDQAVPDKNYIKRFLTWTGKNVTAFYVVQWLLIGNIATALYKSQTPLLLPVWLVIVLLLTTLLTIFWIKLSNRSDK